MSSTVKKKKNALDVHGNKWCHISTKHYKPHHRKLQKKLEYLDSDYIGINVEVGDEVEYEEYGINKESHYIHDADYIDENKDCY